MTSEETTTQTEPASVSRPKKWRGLLVRKERWVLSWRGRVVVAFAILVAALIFLFRVHPFLAETHREHTNVLVVEGWIHEYAIRAAVQEFRNGGYEHVYTTGGPVEGSGGYINDFNTVASVGADLLKGQGLPRDVVQMVPSRVMDRDRTYGSAVALRNWFREHGGLPKSINVLTEDAHSRRTRLLFQKAFGKDVNVGVISVPNPDYNPKRWWRYSAGVREVTSEIIAYVYAKLVFHPTKAEREGTTTETPKLPATTDKERGSHAAGADAQAECPALILLINPIDMFCGSSF